MKKLFLGLALCLALVTVAPAAVISVTDNFSVSQVHPLGVAAFSGSTPNSNSLAGVWGDASSRTLTSNFLGGTGAVSSLVNAAGYYSFAQDPLTNGQGTVSYLLGTVDLTSNASYGFTLDFLTADTGAGTLEFFITDGLITNWSAPIALGAPGVTLAGGVSTAGMTAATALGFRVTGTSERDYTFDNFSAAVPEPGTYALMGAGLAALAFLRRRK